MSSVAFEDSFFDFDRFNTEVGFTDFPEHIESLPGLEQLPSTHSATWKLNILQGATDPAFQQAAVTEVKPASSTTRERQKNQDYYDLLTKQWQSGQLSDEAIPYYEIFEDSIQTDENAVAFAQSNQLEGHINQSQVTSSSPGDISATGPEPLLANCFSSMQATHASSRLSPCASISNLMMNFGASQMTPADEDALSARRYLRRLSVPASEDKVASWLEEVYPYDIPQDIDAATTQSTSSYQMHPEDHTSLTADEIDAITKDVLRALKEQHSDLASTSSYQMHPEDHTSLTADVIDAIAKDVLSILKDQHNDLASRQPTIANDAQAAPSATYLSYSRNGSVAGESSSAASSIASSISLADWASRPRKGRKRKRQSISLKRAPMINSTNPNGTLVNVRSSREEPEAPPSKSRVGINGFRKFVCDRPVDQPTSLPNALLETDSYDFTTLQDWSAGRALNRIYQCTCCAYPRAFTSAYTWQRHEKEMHFPSSMWSCRPVTEEASCLVCSLSDCKHRFRECWMKPLEDRIFSRHTTLEQHLRGYHQLDAEEICVFRGLLQHDIPLEIRQSYVLTCYFCRQPFSDMTARFAHISRHYELDGYTMADWDICLDGENDLSYANRRSQASIVQHNS